MNRRQFSALGLASAATLLLAACSGGSESSSTSLDSVKKAGTIKVGTEGTYKPFTFHAQAGAPLSGYDVDVMNAVAEKIGVKTEYQETQWDAIFAGIDAKRFDIIANQVGINPEREAKYLFSKPYSHSRGVVVAKADSSIRSFEDLKGKKVAQSATSNFGKEAREKGAVITPVEGWAQSVELVRQGRVEATINDKLTVLDYLKANPNSGVKIVAEDSSESSSAFLFRKDSTELRDAVDKALAELEKDGTLKKLSEKYFGTDVSKSS
ncbi:amino acid ABC transporter substrate-binding protein [Falsarthrobacter nasiphocae]|uniref:Cystine transport system substrate-binding protein n=1 Tax=Falsarthrobacter nasiphocae TaxID=189863 RepID=A0AAE4C6R8_9MICC|nr:amino acid ABC transporter substrate-binding protein [Falsarthrobacter nasiphocae]MDR6891729.1 cystine transport system substrate-binding protein [Falsarthrobacter nasiphocae]